MQYSVTLFVLLIGTLLVGTTVVGQEFEPAMKIRDLDWLIGAYNCEGALAPPDNPGEPMGPPVESKVEWERLGDHFLVHRFYIMQNGAMTLNSVIQVGVDPKSNKLTCWGLTGNGIRVTGNVFQSKDTVQFRFAGESADGMQVKATLVIQREGNSKRQSVVYTSIEIGGQPVPVPPTITAIPSE